MEKRETYTRQEFIETFLTELFYEPEGQMFSRLFDMKNGCCARVSVLRGDEAHGDFKVRLFDVMQDGALKLKEGCWADYEGLQETLSILAETGPSSRRIYPLKEEEMTTPKEAPFSFSEDTFKKPKPVRICTVQKGYRQPSHTPRP